jgi:succinoglycan biosynthesis transport protein ExoP
MTSAAKPLPPPETSVISDIREFGQVFRTRRNTIGLITIITALLTAFWTVRQPKIYSATCSVEYNPDPPRPMGNGMEDPGAPISGYLVNQEWYETQNHILSSTAVLERVVRDLQLHRNREFMGVQPGQSMNATPLDATKVLRSRLVVKGIMDTRLVEVTVEDVDPERAAVLANAIADTYLNKSMEDRLGSTQRALEWLSTQLTSTNRQLQTAENELQRYKLTHDVLSVSLEDRQNIIATEIQRFNELLIDARKRRIELQARATQLKSANRPDPFDVHTPEIEGNGEVRQIASEHRKLMVEREGLLGTYGSAHPMMKAVEGKLQVLNARFRKVIDGLIASADAELGAAKDVENALGSALNQANTNGHQLNQQEIEYRRLDRERKNTEGLLELLLKRSAEADLARALKLRYAQVADAATRPDYAIRPRVQLNILMGVLFGFCLGVGVAFTMHRLDSSVRSVDEAEALGLPVLGIIPSINSDTQGTRPSRRRKKRDDALSRNRDLVVHLAPRSPIAECCRTVRTNLSFAMAGAQAKAIVAHAKAKRRLR